MITPFDRVKTISFASSVYKLKDYLGLTKT